MLAGEQLAGAAKAGGDFIGDQQNLRFITQHPDLAKIFRGIETHASGSLDDWFQDDRSDFIMMGLDQAADTGDVTVLPVRIVGYGRCIGEELLGKNLREKMVHARIRIADGHGAGGVAVVAAPYRQHPLLSRAPPGGPVLDCHLHGNLNRNRAGITQKNIFQPLWQQPQQMFGQRDGRLMGKPAEHDMRHVAQLRFDGGIQYRVIVSMDSAPPGRHTVDQFPAIEDVPLKMWAEVKKGRGYVTAETFELEHAPLGTVYLDANFSPVTRVNFLVEDARVGQRTDYDRLLLDVWTNGSIAPEKAVEEAANLVRYQQAYQAAAQVISVAKNLFDTLIGSVRG